jgi:nicotinamidase-related amidase
MRQPDELHPDDLRLEPASSALLIVDVQARLAAAMPEARLAELERNVVLLCELARRFEIPVVVSEQYPRGLGPTTPVVDAAIEQLGPLAHRLEKLEFSVCDAAAFASIFESLGRDQWIVTGMEAHVCVYQSARSLLGEGAQVFVVGDAVASRSEANRALGLSLIERAGGVVTGAEVVVFDVLQRAGSDDFKALSKLLR